MKMKIALVFLLFSTLVCIFIINNKIEFRNNKIKVPKKVIVARYKKIKVSEILNAVKKYNELKLGEVKYDNKNAYICILVNGNIENINNVVNNLRKEKNLKEIKEISISKVSQNDEAEIKLLFNSCEEVN